MSTGCLVLETGEVYSGKWHGSFLMGRAGEVVFNTAHSGYEEIATDPSYLFQIVVMTAPMMGNYGVNREFWESRQFWIEGFIGLQIRPRSGDNEFSWLDRLEEHQIPALSEVDTRQMVLRLRQGGTPWGALVRASSAEEARKLAFPLISERKKADKDWVWLASRREKEVRQGKNLQGPRVGVLDFGCKENILRELMIRCSELIIFPSRTSVQEIIQARVDGVVLTNGPGDPGDVQEAPQTVRQLIGVKPIFGICMGHQILSIALGAKTYKLKFGHRGSNHPIKDTLLNRVYMTSQNHGYGVDLETLPSSIRVTQFNLNDQTVAGIYSDAENFLGIQYHPESHPGPHDAVGLFDFFVHQMIRKGKS